MNSLSELKVVNDDLEMRRYFLYCCFSYAGNWELLKLIVIQNLEEVMFVYILKWEIGYGS